MSNKCKISRGTKQFFGELRLSLPVEEICHLYESGMSENQLAKRYGVGRRAIRNRLLFAGVFIRNQSAAESLKWSFMSKEQRIKQVAAAHRAVRGSKVSWITKCKHAKTIEQRPSNVSAKEIELRKMLNNRGIKTIPQKAIGAYNCDLAAFPVAVEVWSGHWHWHGRHFRRIEERFRYILNAGWNIYVVAINKKFPLNNRVVDYLAAHIKKLRRSKSTTTKYWVVWGAGNYIASGSLNDNHISVVPPFTNARDITTGRYKSVPR